MRFAIFLGCSAFFFFSCTETENTNVPGPPPTKADGPEFIFSPDQMTVHGDWAESELIPAPGGATRIGMLVDLSVADENTVFGSSVEVRGFDSEGRPLDWTSVEVTYATQHSLVARHDPTVVIYAAQMRVPKMQSQKIAHVTFSAVVPEPPGEESPDASDSPPNHGVHKSALSLSEWVQPRSAWNAKKTKCTSYDPKKWRMAVHHTFTPPQSGGSYASRIRGIQAYHMDVKGWCDIGYHYLVTQEGNVWEGRPIKHRGAHVAKNNTGNIGISFVGCFQSGSCNTMGNNVPSSASLNGAANLISTLSSTYGIAKTKSNVKGHLEHNGQSTSCPGDNLLSRIPELLEGPGNDAPDPLDVAPGESDPVVPVEPGSPTGQVGGIVWDASSAASPTAPGATPIKNATVAIVGGPVQIVDSFTASWEFDLVPGTYTITAIAPGYKPGIQLITIETNQKLWNSIALEPIGTQPQTTPTACYPGPNDAWNVCFELTPKSQLGVSGYNYPGGGPNSAQYAAPTHFLDLKAVEEKTKLAKNFVLNEFMQSWKGEFAVYSPKAVAHWQKIRDSLGVPLHVNSGFRSPNYNSGLSGAAPYSRHMFGDAADVTANGAVSLSTIKKKCNAEGADYVSVYTSHVHCDWRNDKLDGGFFAGMGAGKPGVHGREDTQATAWVEQLTRNPRVGHAVYFRAQHTGFDEGIPWVRWQITGPGFERIVEPVESLAFVLSTAGSYRVQWHIGGRLTGNTTLQVQ